MTEEQKKKCEEIINSSIKQKFDKLNINLDKLKNYSIFNFIPIAAPIVAPIIPIINPTLYTQIIENIKLLAKEVFNKDITEEKAKKIFKEKIDDFIKNPKKYKSIEDIFWAIAKHFDNEELKLNLLILGKTGVGKSSLLNALVGKPVAKTNPVKPETQKILVYETEIDGKKVVIYDSWGMEVGEEEKWDEIIGKALKEKGVEKDIKDWFHSVTYCIQAGGHRIEDFDIKIIKQFMEEKYNVIIALTKADQINEEQEREFIKIIKEEIKKETGQEINTIIPISANPEPKRGEKEASEPFGLPEYKAAVLVSWRKIFIERIPLHIIEKLKKDIKDAKDRAPKEGKNMEKLAEEIKEYFKNIIKEALDKYIKENLKGYYKITVNILETSKSIDMKNFDFHGKIDDGDFFIDILDFSSIEGSIASILAIIVASPLFIFGVISDLFQLIAFNIKKSEKISEYTDKVIEKLINEISKKEFEDMIRKIIIETMNNIEKNIPKLN